MSDAAAGRSDLNIRLARFALYRWWRRAIVGQVDHGAVGYGIATRNVPVGAGAFALVREQLHHHRPVGDADGPLLRVRAPSLAPAELDTDAAAGAGVCRQAIPLGISLNRIGREAVAVSQARTLLTEKFGEEARVTQLDLDFAADPPIVRAVVIAPRGAMQKSPALQSALADRLGRPIRLAIDQILLKPGRVH